MKYTKRSYSIWRTIKPWLIVALFAGAMVGGFTYLAGF